MRKKIILIAIAICMIVIFGIVGMLVYFIYSPASASQAQVFFEVKDGQNKIEISQGLKDKELIHSSKIFAYYAKTTNANLKSGLYYFSPSQSAKQIISVLINGEVSEKQITIIEGLRREEIAQYLAKNNITTYADFMIASEGKEGYLFPDTYRISAKASASEIVEKLTNNFKQKTAGDVSQDVLILASIVEREAKQDNERAKIAGVYQNRINIGIKLEADPTVQYGKDTNNAKGLVDFKYWQPISLADYTGVDSNFNTYLNAGLPPAPICNPGLKSIKASLNPEKHNYYYFFHLADGTAIYSKNLAEHNANKLKYQNER